MFRQSALHWIPAVFCALVIYVDQRNLDRVTASQLILMWMPMCFFFVAAASHSMQKQIRELQAEIKELRRGAAGVRHDT